MLAPLALALAGPPAAPCRAEANGILFGPRAFAEPAAAPADGAAVMTSATASAVTPSDAVVGLLDGRDALADAARVRGAQGGKRLRLRRAHSSALYAAPFCRSCSLTLRAPSQGPAARAERQRADHDRAAARRGRCRRRSVAAER